MRTCPDCQGEGTVLAFINRGDDPHSFGPIECRFCGGGGQITDAQHERRVAGRALRSKRVAAGKSLLEASRELGCTPAELSAQERGYA